MKKKSLLLSFVCVACCCIAQTINIPYDATSISDKYRNSNPDYVMYPASLDGKDSIEMTCDLNISSCIEAVDLGLSVKWATCNIGAASPTWNGQYFAWGEICPKEKYNWDTYKLKTKYAANSGKTELEPCDDVATDFWGDEWRLPTKEEFEELLNRCSWTWDDTYEGYWIQGLNCNRIFLPVAGYCYGNYPISQGERCVYWSKTLNTHNAIEAITLKAVEALNKKEVGAVEKGCGLSIRPVCP